MLNLNEKAKPKCKQYPKLRTAQCSHMCAYIIVNNGHTQHSTEQFWLSFIWHTHNFQNIQNICQITPRFNQL